MHLLLDSGFAYDFHKRECWCMNNLSNGLIYGGGCHSVGELILNVLDLTHPWLTDWLWTDWLIVWLITNCKVIQIHICTSTGLFFNTHLDFFFFCSDLKVKKRALPFSFHFSLSPFCACSLSFCISLAGRCYQCSYCQGSKSRGAHESPWQWAHAFPSVGFLCCVLCICSGCRSVIRFVCDREAPIFLHTSYSPVLAAGVRSQIRWTSYEWASKLQLHYNNNKKKKHNTCKVTLPFIDLAKDFYLETTWDSVFD